MENKDFELTNSEQACLLLIDGAMQNIPDSIFTVEVKERLLSLKLIVLDDNINVGWTLTKQGKTALERKVAIKYPMHVKGKIGDYDRIMQTMTEPAKNALACSQVNSFFFDDLPVSTFRIMIQSFIDRQLYRKFGKELGSKMKECLNEYEVNKQVEKKPNSTDLH